jgi:hypothetical protein
MTPQLLGVKCASGKQRYKSESVAIGALISVRKKRIETRDPLEHESRIYPCDRCNGWHLTSNPVVHPEDFTPEAPQHTGESWQSYARRLERRIAEQRAQLLSLHALGHGGTNRQSRKRISTLTVALGRMTERWENERRNREALVDRIEAQPRQRRWLRRAS